MCNWRPHSRKPRELCDCQGSEMPCTASGEPVPKTECKAGKPGDRMLRFKISHLET